MSFPRPARALRPLLLAGALAVVGGGSVPAREAGPARFLIVNSDTTVGMYRSTQATFKETVAISTAEIDLGPGASAERRLGALMRESDPDVIYCIGTRAYLGALEVAQGRKIVVSGAINWRRLPATRTTYGVATELSPAMQLTTFRFVFPDVRP